MLVQALRIGKKIETRKLQRALLFEPALKEPYVIRLHNDKYIVLFRYGVVVFWGLSKEETEQTITKITPYIDSLIENPTDENLEVVVGKEEDKAMTSHIELTELSLEKVAIISEALSRSVALDYFELEIEEVLSGFDNIIDSVSRGRKINLSNKMLLKRVGFAMNIQHLIIGQLAMLDKPSLTWDSAKLDKFYNALSEEYEIEERYLTLSKKLEVMFRNIEFIMSFLDTRRGFYMELIIIALIAVEVVFFLFEKLV